MKLFVVSLWQNCETAKSKLTSNKLKQKICFILKMHYFCNTFAWFLHFYWKETLAQVFSCEFCEISKKHLSRRTSSDILTFLQEKLEFDRERLRQEQKQREREREREREIGKIMCYISNKCWIGKCRLFSSWHNNNNSNLWLWWNLWIKKITKLIHKVVLCK